MKLWVPLGAWLTFVLGPYAWMFITSIKLPTELYPKTVRYWPHQPRRRFHPHLQDCD